MLHSPNAEVGIGALRDGHRLSSHGLKQKVAYIFAVRKVADIVDGQLGFLVVKQSEFHIDSSVNLVWGYYPV